MSSTVAPFGAYTAEPSASAPERPEIAAPWALWQRVLFRFFCLYLLLQAQPWNFLWPIPGMRFVLQPYQRLVDWAVQASNANIFHTYTKLVPVNGSGDTSWAWTAMKLYILVAAVACVVWSVLDRKRAHYRGALFWLRTCVRYYVAAAALSYGVIKLFALQMPFPTTSQLATPLGDLLPMRFSWLFIGYSFPYQFFAGAMETVAGLLLLYRRTVTAGLFAATGAFANVVMINLSYDVPVKLYASHLLFSCLFLLALDSPRLVNLLVLNRATPPTTDWDFPYQAKWQRWGAMAFKVFLLYQILYLPASRALTTYRAQQQPPRPGPFRVGVYDVTRYVVNRDSVPLSSGDTLRWRDVIIDNAAGGSINTKDGVFWQRYGRGYFRYRPDTVSHTAAVWKISTIPRDSTFLFTMRYEVPDTSTLRLHMKVRNDSVHVELKRTARHFQLAERQFHWLSEYNR